MSTPRAARRGPRGLASVAALVAAASSTFHSPALASDRTPDDLRALLSLSYTPACTLCHGHATDADAGPADTPFAAALVARGLSPAAGAGGGGGTGGGDDGGLAKAIDAMRRDGVDSDGDGARDLDELSWGGDPNRYDGPKLEEEPLTYGCAFHGGVGRHAVSSTVLVLAALALGRRRGRRV